MNVDFQGLLTALGVPGQVIGALMLGVAIAAHVMPALPVPTSGGGLYAKLYAVLNWVAGNYANASNAKVAPPAPPSAGTGGAVAACVGLVLLLVGCAAPTTPGQINAQAQQVATDASLIVSGLNSILPQIEATANVPPAIVAELQADIAKAQAAAAALQASVAASAPPGQTEVQAIAAVVGDVAFAVLPAIPGGMAFEPVARAAQVLVSVLLGKVGLPAAAGAAPDSMSAARARLVLATAGLT